jgi:hypothetical protein
MYFKIEEANEENVTPLCRGKENANHMHFNWPGEKRWMRKMYKIS